MKNLLRAFALVMMLCSVAHAAEPQTDAADGFTITPAHLANGSPYLIKVDVLSEAAEVFGRWQNRHVAFFPAQQDNKIWYALAGVDVDSKPGTYPLVVEIRLKNGHHQTLHKEMQIAEAPYTKVTLHVPDKFVEPDPEALKQIAADKIVKDKAFADTAATPEWTGSFTPPLKQGVRSDSFGTRRVFNGSVASIHHGLDYHAATGTPVAAINSGRVVLATPLYFEGGCVMIDHGMGLMSIYMHLSKIEVHTGENVHQGQVIALSGGSGRATGPHLHLGVRWQGGYLDPAKLFALTLPATR